MMSLDGTESGRGKSLLANDVLDHSLGLTNQNASLYHKHLMDLHPGDPKGDYSYNHAHDKWHIDYKIHNKAKVHIMVFL